MHRESHLSESKGITARCVLASGAAKCNLSYPFAPGRTRRKIPNDKGKMYKSCGLANVILHRHLIF